MEDYQTDLLMVNCWTLQKVTYIKWLSSRHMTVGFPALLFCITFLSLKPGNMRQERYSCYCLANRTSSILGKPWETATVNSLMVDHKFLPKFFTMNLSSVAIYLFPKTITSFCLVTEQMALSVSFISRVIKSKSVATSSLSPSFQGRRNTLFHLYLSNTGKTVTP